jgi:hypothetical protein
VDNVRGTVSNPGWTVSLGALPVETMWITTSV